MVLSRIFPTRSSGDASPRDFRRRFVVGGVGLILVAGLLIGAVSAATVGRQLLANLDQELAATATRLATSLDLPGSEPQMGPGNRLNRPGFDVGTLIAVVGPDQTSGAFIAADGQLRTLPEDDLHEFAKTTWQPGVPQSVHIGSGFREVRTLLVDQLGDTQLVVGLPMTDIRQTIGQLTFVVFGIVAIVVAIAAGLGMWGLRLALRPLDQMRNTANTIASQSFDAKDSRLTDRVPQTLADPETEIGQLGAAFNHMLDRLDSALYERARSEEKVRQFVSDASHELRTPLASIRGYSEITLAHEKKLPEKVRSSLGRIESESIRMSRLVDDLLLLARLDEGDTGDFVDVDLGDLVKTVVDDATVRAPRHPVSLDVPRHPVIVKGNADQLVQMLTNIVQNAIVHTPDGTAISVALVPRDDRVVVRVVDTGPGIPVEIQGSLFERFRRGDKGRARSRGSTGLGLAIAQSICAAHGGSIDVQSSPGNTVFTLSLPLAHEPQFAV